MNKNTAEIIQFVLWAKYFEIPFRKFFYAKKNSIKLIFQNFAKFITLPPILVMPVNVRFFWVVRFRTFLFVKKKINMQTLLNFENFFKLFLKFWRCNQNIKTKLVQLSILKIWKLLVQNVKIERTFSYHF